MVEPIDDNSDVVELEQAEQVTEDGGPVRATIAIKRRRSHSRLDKYLQGRFPRFSRTALQKLIKEGAVTVNGKLVKPSHEVNIGDRIQLILPAPEVREIVPEPIPLTILYEDEYLVAIDKPCGMVVHPARGYRQGTLVNAVAYYCRDLSHGDDPIRPGIVHRLDKDTTGVIVVAKTDEAHWRLALQFERRRVHKEYRAVVEGELELDRDKIDVPIGAHRYVRERCAVRDESGRPAVTVYEVLERLKGFTYVRLLPETGRTHQLRVHMSFLRHPIVGDTLYGARGITVGELLGTDETTPAIARFALHAARLGCRHPITGTPLAIESPVPEDFETLLNTLRRRAAMR